MSLPVIRRRVAVALVSLAGLALSGCMDRVTEHRVRGNAHFRKGDFAGAIAEYDEGLRARPDDPATWILKGNALYELNRLDEARQAYARALDRDPRVADAIRGLAVVASRKGDLDEAAARFEALLRIPGHEHDASTRVNLAKIYLSNGKLDRAEAHAVEAGHTDGRDEQVLFTLGRVYLAEGKVDEASSSFQHLVDVAPTRASGSYGLAMVAAKRGDRDAALARLREAVSKGVPEPKMMAKEPAFATLKDDPEFVALADRAARP